METLDRAMNSIKDRGFINYYGRSFITSLHRNKLKSHFFRYAALRHSIYPNTFHWTGPS